ncbi:MAG: sulfatase-like hydrolase/transferase, partial [Planctomycetes bacterium]|nr:sulfatase-like hydrolase/transferase [Planctomycetota bacterium]
MSGWSRALWGVLTVLVLAIALIWMNRSEILLKAVEIAAARRIEIGPNRPIDWDSGDDPRGRARADRPPNIVLILADDLGWNDLTFGGGGVAGGSVPTPNIDSIAADGVEFRNGYAANGTCAPSRAAIMSGRYGTRFGFEFTPTPPGMGTAIRVISSQMPGRLRKPISNPDFESVP